MANTADYAAEKQLPVTSVDDGFTDASSSINTVTALVEEDQKHDIKLRTMSWQKAAWLLCGDQVCLAIMAQTWSLSLVPLVVRIPYQH